ncbi:hypothetical protein LCGC14_1997150 [marine sediment metagenome]|uniref:Uncharacterized protein n=1 Tax=marine sediment metagenome TaxID=412755 RepID=A0A0F9I1E9_9ZZZZ
MEVLTKELMLMSFLQGSGASADSAELTFNLARRSGVVVNQITSQIMVGTILAIEGSIQNTVAQEVDLDPDNIDVQEGNTTPADVVIMDSSRIFRHQAIFQQKFLEFGTNAGGGFGTEWVSRMDTDFRMLPLNQRPISITNLRHHYRRTTDGTSGIITGLITLRYQIVELTLQELGIINAGRR